MREDLLSTDVGSELILMDPRNHEVHNLNESASGVFRALREGKAVGEDPEVELALALFQEKGFLLSSPSDQPLCPERREVLLNLCRAAALPLVTSLAIPAPAGASSSVTEEECSAGLATCMQPCASLPGESISNRVCASFTPNGPCACVDPATAVCECTGRS